VAASYTTTDFLSSVRMRGSIPTTTNANNVNSTANLLALATEELHLKLVSLIMSVREEFYVANKDYDVTANQASYAIPSRAVGMVLRDVLWIDDSGAVTDMQPVDPETISTTNTGEPEGYYLEHNNVVLYPTPNATSGTLRLRHFQRPSRLAATSACAQVSAINTGTNTVTVSSLPSSMTTGITVDFVDADAPYNCHAIDQAITGVSGSDVTFSSLPSGLAVGDWIALAEYSPIPQVPHEFQSVLAQMTVVRALRAIGDRDGAAVAEKELNDPDTGVLACCLKLITPRVQGTPKKVVSRTWR
jgi:hypothetical protein